MALRHTSPRYDVYFQVRRQVPVRKPGPSAFKICLHLLARHFTHLWRRRLDACDGAPYNPKSPEKYQFLFSNLFLLYTSAASFIVGLALFRLLKKIKKRTALQAKSLRGRKKKKKVLHLCAVVLSDIYMYYKNENTLQL